MSTPSCKDSLLASSSKVNNDVSLPLLRTHRQMKKPGLESLHTRAHDKHDLKYEPEPPSKFISEGSEKDIECELLCNDSVSELYPSSQILEADDFFSRAYARPRIPQGEGSDDLSSKEHKYTEKEKMRFTRELWWASLQGDEDVVRHCLSKGACVNGVGEEVPLFDAAERNHTSVISALLAAGADVNKEKWLGTALGKAAEGGHIEAMRLLIDHGAEIDKGRVCKALGYAAAGGHIEAMRLLILCGAKVNKKSFWGTPLTVAAGFNHPEAVAFLLASGADVQQEIEGETALDIAVRRNKTNIIQQLQDHISKAKKDAYKKFDPKLSMIEEELTDTTTQEPSIYKTGSEEKSYYEILEMPLVIPPGLQPDLHKPINIFVVVAPVDIKTFNPDKSLCSGQLEGIMQNSNGVQYGITTAKALMPSKDEYRLYQYKLENENQTEFCVLIEDFCKPNKFICLGNIYAVVYNKEEGFDIGIIEIKINDKSMVQFVPGSESVTTLRFTEFNMPETKKKWMEKHLKYLADEFGLQLKSITESDAGSGEIIRKEFPRIEIVSWVNPSGMLCDREPPAITDTTSEQTVDLQRITSKQFAETKPVILSNRTMIINNELTITCSFVLSAGSEVGWFKDGDSVKIDKGTTIVKDDNQSKLIIAGLKPSHAGTYQCIVETDKAEAVAEIKILKKDICKKLQITKPLIDAFWNLRETKILRCEFNYSEVKTVQWLKDGNKLQESDKYHINSPMDQKFSELTVTEVQTDDKGSYKCVVSNSFGRAETQCKIGIKESGTVDQYKDLLKLSKAVAFYEEEDGVVVVNAHKGHGEDVEQLLERSPFYNYRTDEIVRGPRKHHNFLDITVNSEYLNDGTITAKVKGGEINYLMTCAHLLPEQDKTEYDINIVGHGTKKIKAIFVECDKMEIKERETENKALGFRGLTYDSEKWYMDVIIIPTLFDVIDNNNSELCNLSMKCKEILGSDCDIKGQEVEICGATSGKRTAKVTSIKEPISYEDEEWGLLLIVSSDEPFLKDGDSGSLVVTNKDPNWPKAVGIAHMSIEAGKKYKTFVTPIWLILEKYKEIFGLDLQIYNSTGFMQQCRTN